MAPKQLSRKSKPATTLSPVPYHLRALLGRPRKGKRSSRRAVMKKATLSHDDTAHTKAAMKKKGAWHDVKCPICLETPQKAILLLCSEGACLPYVCDTNYILCACFNQICDKQSVQRPPKRGPDGKRPTSFHFPADRRRPSCPLCKRGEVTGWIVDEPGREAMDAVVRTCKIDSCGIRGNFYNQVLSFHIFYARARRSFKALRWLVMLQGVVRGQNVNRRTWNAMKHMQLLLRVQTQIVKKDPNVGEPDTIEIS